MVGGMGAHCAWSFFFVSSESKEILSPTERSTWFWAASSPFHHVTVTPCLWLNPTCSHLNRSPAPLTCKRQLKEKLVLTPLTSSYSRVNILWEPDESYQHRAALLNLKLHRSIQSSIPSINHLVRNPEASLILTDQIRCHRIHPSMLPYFPFWKLPQASL